MQNPRCLDYLRQPAFPFYKGSTNRLTLVLYVLLN